MPMKTSMTRKPVHLLLSQDSEAGGSVVVVELSIIFLHIMYRELNHVFFLCGLKN